MSETPMIYPPGSVLFACNTNAIRSPMAEGIMRQAFGRDVHVESCGVRTGEVNGFAISVMQEIGIDIAAHSPRTFQDLEDPAFDWIISLTPEAQHSAVELTRNHDCDVLYWPTYDPLLAQGHREHILDAFRHVRDDLQMRIMTIMDVKWP